jgi:hypothetical protein
VQEVDVTGALRPSYRSEAVVAATDTGFVLIGGLLPSTDNMVWRFDANASSWSMVPKITVSVDGGCGAIDSKGVLFIYARSDHLYQYDTKAGTVNDLHVTGDHATEGVTCCIRNGTMYLFGGGVGGRCTSTISKYDTTGTGKEWITVTPQDGPAPSPREGASGLLFGDNFVMWGGSCNSDDANVWTYNLVSNTWITDSSPSTHRPNARSYHSAAIDGLATSDTFVIFGGKEYSHSSLYNDSWVYNLKNMTWNKLEPEGPDFPEPREKAAFVYTGGRFFIFSGAAPHNESIQDFWQLVITEDCYDRKSCDECVNTDGCGWCAANHLGYECIPGYGTIPYVHDDCSFDFSTDLTTCPADAFPGWVVALIIVASILVIGVVWYLVIRCQKKGSSYEQIN